MKTHVPDVQVESFVCSICGLITKYLDVIKVSSVCVGYIEC